MRYLEGFGPASVAGVAQFALVPRTRVKEVLKSLSGTERKTPCRGSTPWPGRW
jgi:hypothetical protein